MQSKIRILVEINQMLWYLRVVENMTNISETLIKTGMYRIEMIQSTIFIVYVLPVGAHCKTKKIQ
jgi:hypothetical protein